MIQNTQVMATVTAAQTAEPSLIKQMRKAGLKGVRINSAHVTPDKLKEMICQIRDIDSDIIILMDTKGPEMRTTALAEPINYAIGDTIVFSSDIDDTPSSLSCLKINVPMLHTHLSVGQNIEFDDGEISATIIGINGEMLSAKVTSGGTLGSRKTMTAEGFDSSYLPAVNLRDRLNIEAAREAGIDIIAHSFVRSSDDVQAVKGLVEGSKTKVYAKVECQQALDNLDEIIRHADGILVARGDLGTAVDPCCIPVLQADIIARCRRAEKPTIVATQIMQSMMENPRPTRAEISDIAFSVIEGVDWLLLCGETAQGRYPVNCVEIMTQTIRITQQANLKWKID